MTTCSTGTLRTSRAFKILGLLLPLVLAACGAPEETGETEQGLTSPVPSVKGLPGSYSRMTAVKEMSSMSLGMSTYDGFRMNGPYTRILSLTSVESGTYSAIPDNPAVGPLITFTASITGKQTSYFIEGIVTNLLGQVTSIQLQQPNGPAFVMQRTF